MLSRCPRLILLCLALSLPACASSSDTPTTSPTPGNDAALPDVTVPDAPEVPDAAVPDAPLPDTSADDSSVPLPEHPNFIFILGEAMGWTITSTLEDENLADSKSPVNETPNLDSIAAQGVHFTDFYAPSPRCMPSRASLITGQSPAQLHMTFIPEGNKDGAPTGNVVPPTTVTDLPTATPTIATMLAAQGYASAHLGKWHAVQTDPAANGFVLSDGPTANGGPDNVAHPNPTEAYGMTQRAIAFMTAQTQAGKPFYLQVSHYNAHVALDATAESNAAESARLAGQSADVIGHGAALRDVDITVGQILAALNQLGIAERTYIFFSSDHGSQGSNGYMPLTQGKGTIWEGGIRVPLFVRGPGIKAGSVSRVRATGLTLCLP